MIDYVAVHKSVDLQASDSFKILYLTWFSIGRFRLYSVKQTVVRAISFCLLDFGTLKGWGLYGFPVFFRIFI
jgi:hypothetical protein